MIKRFLRLIRTRFFVIRLENAPSYLGMKPYSPGACYEPFLDEGKEYVLNIHCKAWKPETSKNILTTRAGGRELFVNSREVIR